ncbi:CueP family metal-binding protein [Micromonospora sp. WMMD1082]|uniref:CueP family metal-binding protein n=1 Tax=Micromonospora sp. WMMD1082 TaxID=3016104 RepID=UPI002417F1EC|nr:CueP family metal-binding protein [Micromonospora sp. WMMD1082]MDG4794067.1 CueP family metal-binding protein [Micromonospora sp. WMMD1082]
MRRQLLIATVTSALLLTGCATGSGSPSVTTPSVPASESLPAESLPGESVPAEAIPLLSDYGLGGKSAVEVIDHLDRLGGDQRPADLTASVRPQELVVSRGDEKFSIGLPQDRFYLSVAPYMDRTHDCFYHSLTTCKGELTAQDVQVRIVDQNDRVLVDEVRTTFDNGFVGFWLPRGVAGTLRLSYDGKVGQTAISTGDDAPTCLTTLRLT